MDSFFYLSFCVLNVISFLLLIYYIFKCTAMINKKIGIIPAVFFFFALPSLLSSFSSSNIPKKSNYITLNTSSDKVWTSDRKTIVMEDQKFSKLTLEIQYQETDAIKNTPLSIGTSQTGLMAGINWLQKSISITPIKDNTYHYDVLGQYEWSFLGLKLYTQTKHFKGQITLK